MGLSTDYKPERLAAGGGRLLEGVGVCLFGREVGGVGGLPFEGGSLSRASRCCAVVTTGGGEAASQSA
eukprot:9467842-Pyramimonas_sp.AAC.4